MTGKSFHMKRTLLAAALSLWPSLAFAQQDQQALVDRATLAVQEMTNLRDGTDARSVLTHARAVLVCPQVFRAGFLFGGSGGNCVLVARDGGGSWGSPAFYGIGSASFGFQAGIQDAEIVLFIMTDRGLSAIMDDQFKLGADASATFVSLGGGVEGATTAALRADIVGFTRARGLFAGIALSGSLITQKTEWNQAYYGRAMAGRQIVVDAAAANPAADPLRLALLQAGAPPQPLAQAAPYAPPSPYGAPGSGYATGAAGPRGVVQAQPLPPPSRP